MQEPSVSDPVFTLTSGPVDAYPAVLRALSRTVLYDYDPAFLACYERVNEKAREALRTTMPPKRSASSCASATWGRPPGRSTPS